MSILDPLLNPFRTFRGRHCDDESGNSLVEYALLLALIVIVCIAAVTMISEQTQSSLSSAASHL